MNKLQTPEDDIADAPDLGDHFMLGHRFETTSELEIGNLFGKGFIAPLLQAPVQAWHGPVSSSYGVHLVYVYERVDARNPSLDEVRDLVERKWAAAKQKEINEAFYQSLLECYTVRVEKPQSLPMAKNTMNEAIE